jgi:aspartyl-tRNA(Asn)/glutamyl-tRNA(Gln) amidotransferase subunit C
MKVTEQDVKYAADLANLELSAEEQTRMRRDLDAILGYIDSLSELDTANVPRMAQVSHMNASSESHTGDADGSREDIHEGLRKSLPHSVALQNAPDSDGIFFKVPKVIER